MERFWLQSDAVVCVLAGLGLSWTRGELEKRLGHGEAWRTASWVLTVALLARMAHANRRSVCHSNFRPSSCQKTFIGVSCQIPEVSQLPVVLSNSVN